MGDKEVTEGDAMTEQEKEEEEEMRVVHVAKKPMDMTKTRYEQELVRLMAEVNFVYAEVCVRVEDLKLVMILR